MDREEKIKAIEEIEGLDEVRISVFDENENFVGTKISFSVAPEFNFFCEVFADYSSAPEDHLNIWTEKIS